MKQHPRATIIFSLVLAHLVGALALSYFPRDIVEVVLMIGAVVMGIVILLWWRRRRRA
ncbi:MAG: hypothetical protein HC884_11130 [Chloroflexaceae bacterium]|nr:hypothetical protein [Chloroflexaceae bacterium]